jgi:hypothetical protein
MNIQLGNANFSLQTWRNSIEFGYIFGIQTKHLENIDVSSKMSPLLGPTPSIDPTTDRWNRPLAFKFRTLARHCTGSGLPVLVPPCCADGAACQEPGSFAYSLTRLTGLFWGRRVWHMVWWGIPRLGFSWFANCLWSKTADLCKQSIERGPILLGFLPPVEAP